MSHIQVLTCILFALTTLVSCQPSLHSKNKQTLATELATTSSDTLKKPIGTNEDSASITGLSITPELNTMEITEKKITVKEIKALPSINTADDESIPDHADIPATRDGIIDGSSPELSEVMITAPRHMEKASVACGMVSIRSETRGSGASSKVVTVAGAAPAASAAIMPALAGKLTAGEINDFQKWKMWEDIADGELSAYQSIWKLAPEKRYSVFVSNTLGFPVCDAEVKLLGKSDSVLWVARTDNTGRAELWAKFDSPQKAKRAHAIIVTKNGHTQKMEDPTPFEQGINAMTFEITCGTVPALDLAFTVDATGSMQDEINYLQAELVDVVSKIKQTHPKLVVRTAAVFYRDHGDTYVTQHSGFTEDLAQSSQFISEQYADGGGDGPEAVDDALYASVHTLNWSRDAVARINFLILDAPPHGEEQNIERLVAAVKESARKGIRIVPLVASGGGYDMDKSLEYLMRCCALATNGTYAFLTNHSGIGNPHTAPSTDHYEVESLNALLIRIMNQYIDYPSCNMEEFLATSLEETETIEQSDSTSVSELLVENTDSIPDPKNHPDGLAIRCYPNPADDYTWLELPLSAKEIFLTDNNGKIIFRWTSAEVKQHIDLSSLPSGIYHFRAWIDEKWLTTRVIVAKI